MATIGGVAHFKVDGTTYTADLEEGFQVNIQQNKFTPVMGSDGTAHKTVMPVADTIKGSLLTVPGFNPSRITEEDNATIQVILSNGRSAVLKNAFFTGDATVSTKDGKMQIEFTGNGRWL